MIEIINYHSETIFLDVVSGKDVRISEMGKMIKEIVRFKCDIFWSKSMPIRTKRKIMNMTRNERMQV